MVLGLRMHALPMRMISDMGGGTDSGFFGGFLRPNNAASKK